ncbi:tyrosine-type recombinase/integrase, partial [Candidatus Magnetobacterium casense]
GSPISRFTLDKLMKLYGAKADIPADKRHFHVLKHSISTHLLDAGADIRFVQDWIGHINIQNTVVYAQISNRAREAQARKLFASPMIVGT